MIKKIKRELSFGEEVANSISHGSAALLMMFLSPFIAVYIYSKSHSLLLVFSMVIFTLSITLMFLSSMIYHFLQHKTKHKQVLRMLDHIFIYVAIAGSYTPIGLYIIGGVMGITMVILQWVIVIFGILYKTLVKKSTPKISMTIYITMGWLAILILPRLLSSANITLMSLILLGGIFYTIGAILYSRQFKYAHFVWHLFVIFGAGTHLVANIFFIH